MSDERSKRQRVQASGKTDDDVHGGMDREELNEQHASPLPGREALSIVSPDPNSALGLEMAEDVPAADPAPVGGRLTIQPVEEEQM